MAPGNRPIDIVRERQGPQGTARVKRFDHRGTREHREDTQTTDTRAFTMRLHRCKHVIALSVVFFCVLCASVVDCLSPPRRRSAASRRAAASAAPTPCSSSTAPGWPTPRRSSSTRPASASPSSKSSTTTRSRRRSRSPPTAGSANTPSASAPPAASRELRTFWVGALPVVDEKEPNSDFTAPQKIPLNVTVHGVVDNEDVDYFAVECKKGQRLTAEIEGMRLGEHALRSLHRHPRQQALRAGRLRRHAAAGPGRVPARSSSRPTARTSSRCARAPTAATAAASIGCTSAPSRGRRPSSRPAASSARKSKSRFLGDPAGPFKQKVKLPAAPDAEVRPVRPGRRRHLPRRRSRSACREFGNVVETEPQRHARRRRRRCRAARRAQRRHRQAGRGRSLPLHGEEGADLRRPLLRPPARLAARFGDDARRTSAAGRSSATTTPSARTATSASPCRTTSEYVLSVTDHLSKGGPTYFYRVEFTPVQADGRRSSIPKVALVFAGAADRSPCRAATAMATLVNVGRARLRRRAGRSAPTGLPAGVTMNAENMPANLDAVPVVFEAGADAPRSAASWPT